MEDMTLDELARMVAKGFATLESRIEARLDEVKEELRAEMQTGFREVHARIDMLFLLHEDHSRRIKNLELKVG